MKVIENVNFGKILSKNKTSEHFNSFYTVQDIAHSTNIRLSNVTVKKYLPYELKGCQNKRDSYFFFISEDGFLNRITLWKKEVIHINASKGWEKALEDSATVYEVSDKKLLEIYKNGRENNYHLCYMRSQDSPEKALKLRLKEFKQKKITKLGVEGIQKKAQNAMFETSKNLFNPSKEYLDKLPSNEAKRPETFCRNVCVELAKMKEVEKYCARVGVDEKPAMDSLYTDSLFNLYSLVKFF